MEVSNFFDLKNKLLVLKKNAFSYPANALFCVLFLYLLTHRIKRKKK